VKLTYPSSLYNPISLIGVSLALFGLAAIIILWALDVFTGGNNPYLGIFIFLVFPGVLVAGLLLIPAGAWRERVRRSKGKVRPMVVDLGNPHHRNAVVTFAVGTSVFLLLTTLGLYKGYQYSESVTFCGKVCHQVMEPEHTAYFNSAHAEVHCVRCHIGPGADWFVRSKLSGARQVFKTALGTYPRPIPTPVHALRPAQEVCEQCHWPEKFFPATYQTNEYFLSDEENTRWQVNLLIKVGGTSKSPRGHPSGIHWHVDEKNHMTYVASDSSRQGFDQVTWYQDGEPVVYSKGGKPLTEEEMAEKEALEMVRHLDCMDCHNRPSHRYKAPMEAVNEVLTSGELDPAIPFIKREAVKVLSRVYSTKEGARDSIALGLRTFYEQEGYPLPDKAVQVVQAAYARNMFPEMKVRWDRYPDNQGHLNFPGCFRCHGSDLENQAGETISNDCSLCHVILAQGPVDSLGAMTSLEGQAFRHPIDIDGAEREMPCNDCHIGDDSQY
jgi:hypothetical protein